MRTTRLLVAHYFLLHFYPGTKYELDRLNRFKDMAIENYTRRLTAAILDLVQPEVETFDPPTRKPYHRTRDSRKSRQKMAKKHGKLL